MATWNDPSPLANPFNTRQHGNFNTGAAARGAYIRHTHCDPKDLTVPNQDIPYNGSPEWNELHANSGLTVPNQDVPLGDRQNNFGNSGFLNDRLFRLADGTVIDFKTGKIMRGFRHNAAPPGYWNDPSAEIGQEEAGFASTGYWNTKDGPSLEELVRNTDRWVGTASPGGVLEPMDPRSAAYWLHAEEEAEKLKANMTDEQKAVLAAFQAHFPKSRLIEESKKPKGRIL